MYHDDLHARAGRYLMIGLDPDGRGDLDEELAFVEEIRPFGVILFARNMPSTPRLLELTGALAARFPELLVAVDHEGGRVDRMPPPFTRFPPALAMAAAGDPGLLREVGRVHGRELRAAGFHINFAPVLDVHTNPDNPVIGDRAFGTTPEEVVHHALPYLQGLTEAGIIGCGKHFPGHGDTSTDSHLELPCIDHAIERIRSLEIVPFARAIGAGLTMIMTAHVLCPAIDSSLPASLSEAAIEGLLRRELRFRGVVVSDDLEMRAVADHWGVSDAARLAAKAGSDLLLVCKERDAIREAHAALVSALERGEIDRGREADAERRRRKLTRRAAHAPLRGSDAMRVIGAQAHAALASRWSQIG